MRRICSICGKKEPLILGSIFITEIDGVPYCQHCYGQKFGELDAHPIPDSVFAKGGISNISIEQPTENEFVFYRNQMNDAKMRIHKLMWYPILRESYDSFWGIDRYSGKYVSVIFSEDDTSSDGGPSYLRMSAFTPAEFQRVMKHLYAEPIHNAFADVTQKSWEEYLDVSVPIWQSKLAFYLTQQCGNIVKIVKFPYNGLFTYAEVPAEAYSQWTAGKSPLEQIASIGELTDVAIHYIERIVPKILRPCKGLYEHFTKIYAESTPSGERTWNLIQVKEYCKEINLRNISADQTTALFDFIEKTYYKELMNRVSK